MMHVDGKMELKYKGVASPFVKKAVSGLTPAKCIDGDYNGINHNGYGSGFKYGSEDHSMTFSVHHCNNAGDIEKINIWNRTGWCARRLNKSVLEILEEDFEGKVSVVKKMFVGGIHNEYCFKCESRCATKDCDGKETEVTCKYGHKLCDIGLTRNNGWSCDGRKGEHGCASTPPISGFRQTNNKDIYPDGVPRYRCQKCDFDYCEACYQREASGSSAAGRGGLSDLAAYCQRCHHTPKY